MGLPEKIKQELILHITEYYATLKSSSVDYGMLKQKIRNCVYEEKWHDSKWGAFIEEVMEDLYNKDVRNLPVIAQATDKTD